MDYTQIDIANEPDSFEVYRKPRYILGKVTGPLVRFYTLDEMDSGSLRIASTSPRTIPLAVFNANFTKVSDHRAGGIFIKTPMPTYAVRAKEPGNLSTKNIETGKVETRMVRSGDVLIGRSSGLVEAMSEQSFEATYVTQNPATQEPPKLGADHGSEKTLS